MRLTKKVARLPSKGLGISGTEFVNRMRKMQGNNISFSPSVKFTEQFQQILLRPQVKLIRKQVTGQESMSQRGTNQVATLLKNCRSVLGDHGNRSP